MTNPKITTLMFLTCRHNLMRNWEGQWHIHMSRLKNVSK